MSSDARISKILLTGATGYVGGRLLPVLEEAGYSVRSLARRGRALPSSGATRHDEGGRMRGEDEPALKQRSEAADDRGEAVQEQIRALLERQLFGVLCTAGEGQPYGSVVAFAADEPLRSIAFVTSRETRKYRLLTGNDHVAFVVDDRDRHPDELMTVGAITATGRATEVTDEAEHGRLAELFISKHPTLRTFVEAPSTALFRIDVVRYLHVWRFQEVRQWVPAPLE